MLSVLFPSFSIFSMKRVPSHTAEMIEGDVTNNISHNSVVSNSVAIEPRVRPTVQSQLVKQSRQNAIDPHRDIPVRRVVSPGEQTIPQERVQVRIDELNVELLTSQFVEEHVDVMVDIPVLPQIMRYSFDVW